MQDSPDPRPSSDRDTHTFEHVLARYLSRRTLLQGAAVAGAVLVARPVLATGRAHAAAGTLGFAPLTLNTDDRVTVPTGYRVKPLLRWGDPLFTDAPAFDLDNQSAAAQNRQAGYNTDFVGYFAHPSGDPNRALLAINHEYTNPELMFRGYDDKAPTKEQVDIELAAHGLSVVEITRSGAGEWSVAVGAPLNRRLTGETPMTITGPAAGHPWLRTAADPSGRAVRGTLNNCGGGKTPWGTVLTAEENFNQYFANVDAMADDDARKAVHRRYGLTAKASERKWETYHPRFDVSQEVNEAFRFGWVVEIDPSDPTATPRKRTALGRLKHEAATTAIGPDGRVAVYTGDDERFEYAYKFVTAGRYDASNRAANLDLLDDGTLYVARFNDDGTGVWLPLSYGQGPLTEANGFTSQGDVLIRARFAADAVGATKMDRPEDFEANPINHKIYLALTNNTRRTAEQVNAANPRANNRDGHIIEITEAGDDPTATSFTWELFMVCGEPDKDDSTYFAGFSKAGLSAISSPDNILFDQGGNLWILTDGQYGTLKKTDAIFAVPVAGASRGDLRLFLTAVPGSEVAGGDFADDNEALFVSIQHPNEGASIDAPISVFPDGGPARPTTIVVWRVAGGEKRIGA